MHRDNAANRTPLENEVTSFLAGLNKPEALQRADNLGTGQVW